MWGNPSKSLLYFWIRLLQAALEKGQSQETATLLLNLIAAGNIVTWKRALGGLLWKNIPLINELFAKPG